MTESEMYLIGDLLYSCGKYHVVFDGRTDDKRLLFVTSDAPTIARYVLASPVTTPVQKMYAEDNLKEFIAADYSVSIVQNTPFEEDASVLYCAPLKEK